MFADVCHYPIGFGDYSLSKSTTASTITATTSSKSAQSLKPTATDVFQRLHASHAEAGQKAETFWDTGGDEPDSKTRTLSWGRNRPEEIYDSKRERESVVSFQHYMYCKAL